MMIRLVASVVIAALLMTGAAVTVPQVSEYGASTTTEQVAQQPATTLTGDEAAAIALAHAGLKEADALRKEYDADDGVKHWDIDFRSGDWEYDYEIHAVTGEVLKSEKEYEPVKAAPAVAQTHPPAPVQTTPPAEEKLTKEEAQAIALKHAGLTEVTALRAEYDADDGVRHWDIDFRSGDWEYDYEIHAVTGKVLKGEKEYDPVKPAATQATQPKQTETTTSEKLSKDKAISIALKHAGLEKSQVTRLKAEYDVDDGVPEWDVEFRVGNYEYEYEIHGKTGKIRSWDKEYDD